MSSSLKKEKESHWDSFFVNSKAQFFSFRIGEKLFHKVLSLSVLSILAAVFLVGACLYLRVQFENLRKENIRLEMKNYSETSKSLLALQVDGEKLSQFSHLLYLPALESLNNGKNEEQCDYAIYYNKEETAFELSFSQERLKEIFADQYRDIQNWVVFIASEELIFSFPKIFKNSHGKSFDLSVAKPWNADDASTMWRQSVPVKFLLASAQVPSKYFVQVSFFDKNENEIFRLGSHLEY